MHYPPSDYYNKPQTNIYLSYKLVTCSHTYSDARKPAWVSIEDLIATQSCLYVEGIAYANQGEDDDVTPRRLKLNAFI